jgi:hypothetical protein
MAEYKNQHYVPQSYLAGFTDDNLMIKNDNSLFRLNKESNEIDRKGIKHICSENYFYSFLDENHVYNHTIEKMFSKYETEFKKIRYKANCIRNMFLQKDKLLWFSVSEKRQIIQFLILQLFRVPAKITPYITQMTHDFRTMNTKEGVIQTDEQIINDIKKMSMSHMFDFSNRSLQLYENILHHKNMILTVTNFKTNNGFIASDNPVLISNKNEPNAFIHDKTEITMTLSKNIALSFYEYGIDSKIGVIDDKSVALVNSSFYKNSSNFCFSGNRNNLENILLTTAST